jgi:ElaB/YqjD/DUF883 family membrane-anchored ribosome-binding protein
MNKKHHRPNGKITQAIGLLTEVAQDKRAELYGNLEDRYDHLRHTLGQVSSTVKHKGGVLRRRTETAIHVGQRKVEHTLTKTIRQLDKSIHHHPWKYVGGIALFTFIYGYRMAHRKQRRKKVQEPAPKQEEVFV